MTITLSSGLRAIRLTQRLRGCITVYVNKGRIIDLQLWVLKQLFDSVPTSHGLSGISIVNQFSEREMARSHLGALNF
jgi:ABC-type maltose transport system permease subunit